MSQSLFSVWESMVILTHNPEISVWVRPWHCCFADDCRCWWADAGSRYPSLGDRKQHDAGLLILAFSPAFGPAKPDMTHQAQHQALNSALLHGWQPMTSAGVLKAGWRQFCIQLSLLWFCLVHHGIILATLAFCLYSISCILLLIWPLCMQSIGPQVFVLITHNS